MKESGSSEEPPDSFNLILFSCAVFSVISINSLKQIFAQSVLLFENLHHFGHGDNRRCLEAVKIGNLSQGGLVSLALFVAVE